MLHIVILVFATVATGRHLPVEQLETNTTRLSLYDYFTSGFVAGYVGNETGPDWLHKPFHIDEDSQESNDSSEHSHSHKQTVHSVEEKSPIEGRNFENINGSKQETVTTDGGETSNCKTMKVEQSNFNSPQAGRTNGVGSSVAQSDQVLPVDEDRWIWDDGATSTTIQPAQNRSALPDVDDRTAFDGSSCPKGQIKIGNMCVDTD